MSGKPWKYPLETFFFKPQADGNARVTVRDALRRVIFHMDLDHREYFAVKELKETLGPLVVGLLNREEERKMDGVAVVDSGQVDSGQVVVGPMEASNSNGIGHNFDLPQWVKDVMGKTDAAKLRKIEKRHLKVIKKLTEKYEYTQMGEDIS